MNACMHEDGVPLTFFAGTARDATPVKIHMKGAHRFNCLPVVLL